MRSRNRARLASADGGIPAHPSVGWVDFHHTAYSFVLCFWPDIGAVDSTRTVVRTTLAFVNCPLLCMDISRHTVACAAVRDLLRPAERRNLSRRFSSSSNRLHAQCRRL